MSNNAQQKLGPVLDILFPAVFHFALPGKPCAYWSNGNHIVADGACRCGKKFLLSEYRLAEVQR